MDLATAIFTKLSADPTLTGLLGDYNGSPAIFMSDVVPRNAPLPRIWSPFNITDASFDVINSSPRGRRISRDIMAYGSGSSEDGVSNAGATVEAIAERARTVLHKSLLTITGQVNVEAIATGPVVAPTDETVIGRMFSVTYLIQEI